MSTAGAQRDEEYALANAQNYLRLLLHAVSCLPKAPSDDGGEGQTSSSEPTPAPRCSLGDRCQHARQLLKHLVTECTQTPGQCPPSCSAVRNLLGHWVTCCSFQCSICSNVWAQLTQSAQEPAGSSQAAVPGAVPGVAGSPFDGHAAVTAATIEAASAVGLDPSAALPSAAVSAASLDRAWSSAALHGNQAVLGQPSGDASAAASNTEEASTQVCSWLLHSLLAKPTVDTAQLLSIQVGKAHWSHCFTCPAGTPCTAQCHTFRDLMKHRLTCEDGSCRSCSHACSPFARRRTTTTTAPGLLEGYDNSILAMLDRLSLDY